MGTFCEVQAFDNDTGDDADICVDRDSTDEASVTVVTVFTTPQGEDNWMNGKLVKIQIADDKLDYLIQALIDAKHKRYEKSM